MDGVTDQFAAFSPHVNIVLQVDLGSGCGEPVFPERQIRIIDNPQHSIPGELRWGCAEGLRGV